MRSAPLLRTAYLLTGSTTAAGRLLDDALARAWLAWTRLDEPPEPFVRRLLVAGARGGHRGARSRRTAGKGDETWERLASLTSRQRAVVVLHWYDGLPLDEAAELLGCSAAAAQALLAKALERLGIDPVARPRPAAQPHGAP